MLMSYRYAVSLLYGDIGAGLRKNEILIFLQNTKIVINGSPQGRFEHLGVETR